MNLKSFFIACLFLLKTGLFALHVERFYDLLNEKAPEWMVRQIEHDLSPFQGELSKKYLDALFNQEKETLCLVRIKIESGKISIIESDIAVGHSVPPMILHGIRNLHMLAPLPDMDFIFTGLDTLWQFVGRPCPILTETKSNDSIGLILMPDRFSVRGYEPEKSEVLKGNELYPWDSKKNVLYFRGSDTGVQLPWKTGDIVYLRGLAAGMQEEAFRDKSIWRSYLQEIRQHLEEFSFNKNIWRNYPRPKLVGLSLQNPELIDAKFVDSLHYLPMLITAKKEGFIGSWVLLRDQVSFRYLMDIDGNCASCPRIQGFFHSNSVVFKQITNSMQWFYSCLMPYIHYVPVQEDLSDIFSQIEWAKNHDEECKQMSKNARILAEEVFSEERVYQYLYLLLINYAKKQSMQYEKPNI